MPQTLFPLLLFNVLSSKSTELLQDKCIQLSKLIYDKPFDEVLSPATSTTGDFCKDTNSADREIFNRGMQENKIKKEKKIYEKQQQTYMIHE